MKIGMVVLSALVVLMALGTGAQAAAPYPTPAAAPAKMPPEAAFAIQAKVLKLSKGQFQVQVVRVEKAAAIKAGETLWIRETSKTKILSAGKAVSARMLKVGNRVEISGNIKMSGKAAAYDALSVRIVAPR